MNKEKANEQIDGQILELEIQEMIKEEERIAATMAQLSK